MKKLFKLGGTLNKKQSLIISLLGALFLFTVWYLISFFEILEKAILPNPIDVIASFKPMILEDELLSNLWYSVKLNLLGYVEAIVISVPLGFLIALIPFFNGLLYKYVDAIRFLPLTAVTPIFIAWFGIGVDMKIHFLALGIIVYLLAIIIQRVNETDKVHTQTIWTLGATPWQTFRYVYFPSAMSRIFDDIRVITAISWTYIIVAELVNKEHGIGAMITIAARQSRMDKMFMLLIVIILFGILQDKIFKYADKKLYPFKYA